MEMCSNAIALLQKYPSLPLALAFGAVYAVYYLFGVVKVRQHGMLEIH